MVVVKIRKRHLAFLLIFIVVLGAGVVLAIVPNPGHPINQLEPSCADGQVLKIVNVGGVLGWGCGSGSLWTQSGNNIFYANPDGNVGIGLGNPSAALMLNNNPSTNTQRDSIYVVTEPWGGRSLALHHKGGGQIIEAYNWVNNAWQSVFTLFNNGDLFVRGKTHLEGNVGIGTSSPSQKLDVNGNVLANSLYLFREPGVGGGDSGLAHGGDGNVRLRTDGVDQLTVNNLGNVGIGTSSPTQKLDVEGDIKANRLDISDIDCRGGNCVRSDDIADRAINWWDIALGGVGPGELQDNAVTSSKIANFAVTVNKIAAGVVGTAEILDGGVTSADILDATIRIGDISLETLPATTAWNTLERSCTNGFVISCHCNCVGGGNLLECGASTANTCRGRCNTGNVQVQGFCINN